MYIGTHMLDIIPMAAPRRVPHHPGYGAQVLPWLCGWSNMHRIWDTHPTLHTAAKASPTRLPLLLDQHPRWLLVKPWYLVVQVGGQGETIALACTSVGPPPIVGTFYN